MDHPEQSLVRRRNAGVDLELVDAVELPAVIKLEEIERIRL